MTTPHYKWLAMMSLLVLLGCKQETTAERIKRIEENCAREFYADTYNINRCKLRLLMELVQERDNERMNNARR